MQIFFFWFFKMRIIRSKIKLLSIFLGIETCQILSCGATRGIFISIRSGSTKAQINRLYVHYWLNKVRIQYLKNWSFFSTSPFIWLLENFNLRGGIVKIVLKIRKNSGDFVLWFLTIKHQGSKNFQNKVKYETRLSTFCSHWKEFSLGFLSLMPKILTLYIRVNCSMLLMEYSSVSLCAHSLFKFSSSLNW